MKPAAIYTPQTITAHPFLTRKLPDALSFRMLSKNKDDNQYLTGIVVRNK